MAENPIHFDDFIANVQPDPAKPEATILLFGYVGHGADGEVRVYPDPTLGTWYDIPAADIVHSMAAPDTKLGGSYVWVRAGAQIKPGSTDTTAQVPAPDAGAGPGAAAAAAPAAPQPFTIGQGCAQQGVHPTPTAQPTPATHCFICPPLTQPPGCHPQTHQFPCTETCHTLPVMCPSPPALCTHQLACQQQTHQFPCTETCNTLPVMCQPQTHAFPCSETCVTLPINCIPQTLPNICHVVASPNCPGPGPGTPVQTPQQLVWQQAFGAMQPTPTVQTRCFVCPPLTQNCTQPPACQPSVNVICPTPSAVHQCGQPSVNVICPTPSAVQQCGTLQAQPNQPPSGTMHQCCGVQAGGFPTMQGCPPVTTNCMTMPLACGVFTPFGQR